ncbi:hypothetical protein O3P69_016682 [Scylla paramamosain]|uniref:Uncharacterized protein n=1 Tax=Scylla paramamosain TaxID=85552 RepID=A0AAW0SYY6_SCYPA
MSRRESPILFCEYPFLFDPQAKTLLLRCDATRQMRTRDILNPDYGMFTEFPDTRRIWFKEGALEAAATYVLIGEALGGSGGV